MLDSTRHFPNHTLRTRDKLEFISATCGKCNGPLSRYCVPYHLFYTSQMDKRAMRCIRRPREAKMPTPRETLQISGRIGRVDGNIKFIQQPVQLGSSLRGGECKINYGNRHESELARTLGNTSRSTSTMWMTPASSSRFCSGGGIFYPVRTRRWYGMQRAWESKTA